MVGCKGAQQGELGSRGEPSTRKEVGSKQAQLTVMNNGGGDQIFVSSTSPSLLISTESSLLPPPTPPLSPIEILVSYGQNCRRSYVDRQTHRHTHTHTQTHTQTKPLLNKDYRTNFSNSLGILQQNLYYYYLYYHQFILRTSRIIGNKQVSIVRTIKTRTIVIQWWTNNPLSLLQ